MAEPDRTYGGAGRLRSGLFEIDLTCGELYKSGRKVALQEQPFQVLAMLAKRPGELVTRLELQNKLWPGDICGGFEEGLNTAIRKLRQAFGDSADNPRFIETIPRRGYRFIAPISREISGQGAKSTSRSGAQLVVMEPPSADSQYAERGGPISAETDVDQQPAPEVPSPALETTKSSMGARWKWAAAMAAVCVALIAGGVYWRSRSAVKFAQGDPIIIAEFANSTGDPLFDGTMRVALSLELGESPFLYEISPRTVARTLKQMNRTGTEPLTEDLAREVCRRTKSRALLTGSIANLGNQNISPSGSQYMIGLKAVDCSSGAVLAQAQWEATDKPAVLRALHLAALNLRTKLGEPPTSLQKYVALSEQVEMPSLEAEEELILAGKARYEKGETAALPHLLARRATRSRLCQDLPGPFFNLQEPERRRVGRRELQKGLRVA